MSGMGSVVVFDQLFDDAGAAAMVELCERFGRYRMYIEHEQLDTDIGRGLSQRHDALTNFLRTGGLSAADESPLTLAARTSYFREEYAYGQTARIEGIEPFLHHDGFVRAAQEVHGRAVIEPAIAYANLMVPGQELAVHTDVPEFRGCNRKVMPQWLLVVMHHSGLFDEWRLPIATGIAWFHDSGATVDSASSIDTGQLPASSPGGELVYWPDGPSGTRCAHEVRYNSAMVLDTDTVFHGVDRVSDIEEASMPRLRPGMTLDFTGDRAWAVRTPEGDDVVRYPWEVLRFSVSWKAYCFRDNAERDAWREHRSDLTVDVVLDRLVDDLRARGRVDGNDVARDADLGLVLIDEYVRFPISTA